MRLRDELRQRFSSFFLHPIRADIDDGFIVELSEKKIGKG